MKNIMKKFDTADNTKNIIWNATFINCMKVAKRMSGIANFLSKHKCCWRFDLGKLKSQCTAYCRR